ncbi:MAG: PDZ domain-containing protein [Candidatus Omnitrophota bacterium]|nr:PDZ domain-containing protein [Candidatus Omnitrophota bacterium]
MRRASLATSVAFFVMLLTPHSSLVTAIAASRPSLFRGVVVADGPGGVHVVSVEESSQAYQADLRAGDLILRVDQTELHSIDEFATLSTALKGRELSATVLVFRQGMPRSLLLHLYSYPILREWKIEHVPDHDIRFAEPETGRAYWVRMGRGFEEAGNPREALHAYLNALHHAPSDAATALTIIALVSQLSRERLEAGDLAEGMRRLRNALTMMDRLFEYPLSEEALEALRRQLRDTLAVLRQVSASTSASRRSSRPADN